ncbi:hypothetical protein K488DRAFT_83864 [Vararia minispora EC-137]|uniref:Uncharacterized protein n=1 Tax=Vararia minispora EC-137 TaxID=1314806 RepID=A0ACB8QRQ7_9AGAM|nr:hypothetical protein K488DRAFT_83864 [Vararia minispora EC-137]
MWLLRPQPLAKDHPDEFDGRNLFIDMTLTNIDTAANTMSFTCAIYGDSCAGAPISFSEVQDFNETRIESCTTVDVYFDQFVFNARPCPKLANSELRGTLAAAFDDTNSRSTNVPLNTSAHVTWNASAYYLDARSYLPQFQLNIMIFYFSANPRFATLVAYPFDEYNSQAYFFGLENHTNGTRTPVSIYAAYVHGLAFGYTANLLNFQELANAYGRNYADNIAFDNRQGTTSLNFRVQRAMPVKIYAVVIVVAMCMLHIELLNINLPPAEGMINLILLYIALKATFFGYAVDNAILVIPVTTLFAFTSLRASMPGAPTSFGAYIGTSFNLVDALEFSWRMTSTRFRGYAAYTRLLSDSHGTNASARVHASHEADQFGAYGTGAVLTGVLTDVYKPRQIIEDHADSFNGRQLYMDMTMLSIDPTTNKISFSCIIRGDTCGGLVPDANGQLNPNMTELSSCNLVNIYFDQGALGMKFDGTSSQSNSAPDKTTPSFLWNASALFDPRASEPLFQVDFALYYASGSVAKTLFNYPFDEYLADAFFFGADNVTGDAVSVHTFVHGIAFGFTTKLLQPSEVNAYYGPSYATMGDEMWNSEGITPLHFHISRAALVKTYVLTVLGAMYIVDFILLLISIKAVVFGYNIDNGVLVVPVTSLFSFVTLRQSFPGVPSSFGALVGTSYPKLNPFKDG